MEIIWGKRKWYGGKGNHIMGERTSYGENRNYMGKTEIMGKVDCTLTSDKLLVWHLNHRAVYKQYNSSMHHNIINFRLCLYLIGIYWKWYTPRIKKVHIFKHPKLRENPLQDKQSSTGTAKSLPHFLNCPTLLLLSISTKLF